MTGERPRAHPCERQGCAGAALHPLNFCAADWQLLPAKLRFELRRARGRGRRNGTHPTAEYHGLLARARQALGPRPLEGPTP